MTEKTTAYGRLIIGTKEELFAKAVALAAEEAQRVSSSRFSWALTGGTTPANWYHWCVASQAIPEIVLRRADFTVSDERCVPLTSDQSNFGNADRQLFTPLGLAVSQRVPWPVELSPTDAAATYAANWSRRFGSARAYDVCFLGMGDDAHTASWFPGSPLLRTETPEFFVARDVAGKGWRLTITPAGLRNCGVVVVMALGPTKAEALARVMHDEYNPSAIPAQILKSCADRVVWLVDTVAAARLK